MSDDAASEIASMEALRARFTPVSPHECRSHREYVFVMSLAATLPVGLPESRMMYMPDFTHSNGWVVHIHPDGRLYLHHPEERTVIDYPDDEEALDKIVVDATMCMTALWLAFQQLPLDSRPDRDNCELFLRVEEKSRDILYYFVDYTGRHVFWVQEHTLEIPFASHAQLASILQSQFWQHVERFPAHRCLPLRAQEELQGILAYQIVDVTMNAFSMAPYAPSDTALFFKCVKGARKGSAAIDGALNALVARLWAEQCRVISHTLNGTPQARIAWTEHRGMVALEPPRRWLQLIGLIMLFNEPYGFYKSLMDVFVDGVMYYRFWNSLYHKTLLKEWGGHAFMATVTLTANMAFLAVGNVGGGNGNGNGTGNDALSPTSQVLSLCSTLFSIGAIVMGTALPSIPRRSQRYSDFLILEWVASVGRRHDNGLYKLAMLFGLPFAFFMWSLALFVAALFSFAFEHWIWATCVPVAAVSAVILGVVTSSLLFLSTGAGSVFIRRMYQAPQPSVWRQVRAAVGAVPGLFYAGVLQLAISCRGYVVKQPDDTVVGDQHALDEMATPSRTRASPHSVENKVEIGLEVP